MVPRQGHDKPYVGDRQVANIRHNTITELIDGNGVREIANIMCGFGFSALIHNGDFDSSEYDDIEFEIIVDGTRVKSVRQLKVTDKIRIN